MPPYMTLTMDLVWIVSIIFIVLTFFIDFFLSSKLQTTTFKQNLLWIAVCVGLTIIFLIILIFAKYHPLEFFTGYVVELSLSLDNTFIFLLIITKYNVPQNFQRKVLTIGIAIALISRAFFILVGIGAINKFHWISFILALILFYAAYKSIAKNDENIKESKFSLFFAKHFNTLPDYSPDGKIFVKKNKTTYLTPMFFCIILIGTIDIMFSIDSIPSVLGITKNVYIVLMVNFFALLGLRQIYFLVAAGIAKMKYLSHALCAILVFIGIKTVLSTLEEYNVAIPFKITTPISLGFIILCMLIAVLAEKIPHKNTNKN